MTVGFTKVSESRKLYETGNSPDSEIGCFMNVPLSFAKVAKTDWIRWLTILCGVVFGVATLGAAVVDYLNDPIPDSLREFAQDIMLSLASVWFICNVVRFFDTRRLLWVRLIGLSFIFYELVFMIASLCIPFDTCTGNACTVEYADRVYGVGMAVMGCTALLSLLRVRLLIETFRSVINWLMSLRFSLNITRIVKVSMNILLHPIRSVRRDPIRWSAIVGGTIFLENFSPWFFPSFLILSIALTCLIRYADTMRGNRRLRLAALVFSALSVCAWYWIMIPFDSSLIAWTAPSLVLLLGSAILAMFRDLDKDEQQDHISPETEPDVDADDGRCRDEIVGAEV